MLHAKQLFSTKSFFLVTELFMVVVIFLQVLPRIAISALKLDKVEKSKFCGTPPAICVKSQYRTLDGSCNNLLRPEWGSSNRPYGRLTTNSYSNEVHDFPHSVTGNELPNPRQISLQLFGDSPRVSQFLTLNSQQFGQLIAHDMSLNAGLANTQRNLIECCNDEGQLTREAFTNRLCKPILIPFGDPVHAPEGTRCINFARSITTKDRDCPSSSDVAEPISEVTGFLDLSVVYGNGNKNNIRAGQRGRLRREIRNGQEWPPQVLNVSSSCFTQSLDEPCYLTGDVRGNQNPQLALLHIIFFREHNRIADILKQINPQWNDETVFQEARRINIAEFQHITYYEYLPNILGHNKMIKTKLIYQTKQDYINDYNPNVDPTVLQEHATAAFRHFHTMIRGNLQLVSEERLSVGSARLSDWFDRPLLLEQNMTFDNLVRGLTTQKNGYSDQFFDSEITTFHSRHLKTFGKDLRAWDIQRARDHGLGSYLAVRKACRLPVPKTFNDMLNYMSERHVLLLKSIYEKLEDIELIVAGTLENLEENAQVGATFLCILTEQFFRTRVGDRFFYENGIDGNIAFTPDQLLSIRNASMARIFCDNVRTLRKIQRNAFVQIMERNPLIDCEKLSAVNISLWKDDGKT